MEVPPAAASRARALARNSSSRRRNSCCSCFGSSCSGVRKTLAGVELNSGLGLGTRGGRGAAGLWARGVRGLLLPEPPLPLPRGTHECCPSRSRRTSSTACSSRLWLLARRAGLGANSWPPLPPGAPRGRPRSSRSRDWLRGAGGRLGEAGVPVVTRLLGRSRRGPVPESSLRALRGPLWAEEAEESLSPEQRRERGWGGSWSRALGQGNERERWGNLEGTGAQEGQGKEATGSHAGGGWGDTCGGGVVGGAAKDFCQSRGLPERSERLCRSFLQPGPPPTPRQRKKKALSSPSPGLWFPGQARGKHGWTGRHPAPGPAQLCCSFGGVAMELGSQAHPHPRELFPGCESLEHSHSGQGGRPAPNPGLLTPTSSCLSPERGLRPLL